MKGMEKDGEDFLCLCLLEVNVCLALVRSEPKCLAEAPKRHHSGTCSSASVFMTWVVYINRIRGKLAQLCVSFLPQDRRPPSKALTAVATLRGI